LKVEKKTLAIFRKKTEVGLLMLRLFEKIYDICIIAIHFVMSESGSNISHYCHHSPSAFIIWSCNIRIKFVTTVDRSWPMHFWDWDLHRNGTYLIQQIWSTVEVRNRVHRINDGILYAKNWRRLNMYELY